MNRLISISVALLLVLLAAQAAPAAELGGRQVERMTKKLERLFQPIGAKIEAKDLSFRDLGGGFYSLSYPLAKVKQLEGVQLRADDEKPIRTLAIGHMASEPTNPGSVLTAIVADPETKYNVWLAVLNRADEEETRRTNVRIIGPEEFEIVVSDEVLYQPQSVNLIWFNPDTAFAATGLYTYRINVRTGGKMFYRFWVEPLVSE